jgi:RND family efflux transporter MFP subunit
MSTAKSSQVDLQALAVDRSLRGSSREVRRPRHVFTRYVVPAVLILGFAGLLAWSLRDRWLPATPVSVVPVTATRTMAMATDTPLFTAAGWVEPRPTPVVVSSLVEGVVERLTVIEGQEVAAGEPIAYLVDADARLAIRQAKAELDLRQAELASAEAALIAAEQLEAEPITRQAELADAEAQLTKVETELARLPSQIEAAEARHALAEQEVAAKTAAKDALPALTLKRAQSELAVAKAQIEESRRQAEALAREQTALSKRRDVLRRQLELKIDEQRAAAESRAKVTAAKAQIEQAATSLESAELRLARSVIRAPVAGKVLALVARPGTKLMGLAPAAMADSSTVVTMYDPASLQVRADVRLEDVPHVLIGQSVQIETPAAKGALTGNVVAVTSLADIQKNTLQVKAAIDNPPPVIKPDMLVQVTFLAPPQATPAAGEGEVALRIGVPIELVEGSGDEANVWVADLAAGVARQRKIALGRPISRELVEVTSGLAIGDRLIVTGRESLRDGSRIRVVRADAAMGKSTDDHPSDH